MIYTVCDENTLKNMPLRLGLDEYACRKIHHVFSEHFIALLTDGYIYRSAVGRFLNLSGSM